MVSVYSVNRGPLADQPVQLLFGIVQQTQLSIARAVHGRGVSDALAAHQRPSPAGIHVDVDHLHVPLDGHAGRFIENFGDLLQIRVGDLLNLHVVFYIDHIGDAADFICHGIPQRFRILYDISAVDQRVEKPARRTGIDLQRLAAA